MDVVPGITPAVHAVAAYISIGNGSERFVKRKPVPDDTAVDLLAGWHELLGNELVKQGR